MVFHLTYDFHPQTKASSLPKGVRKEKFLELNNSDHFWQVPESVRASISTVFIYVQCKISYRVESICNSQGLRKLIPPLLLKRQEEKGFDWLLEIMAFGESCLIRVAFVRGNSRPTVVTLQEGNKVECHPNHSLSALQSPDIDSIV